MIVCRSLVKTVLSVLMEWQSSIASVCQVFRATPVKLTSMSVHQDHVITMLLASMKRTTIRVSASWALQVNQHFDTHLN